MSTPFTPPQHFAWITPYLTVSDASASLTFYEKAFGFKSEEIAKDNDGKILHVQLRYQDQAIMMGAEGAYNSPVKAPKTSGVMPPVSLYLYTSDVDAFFAHAKANGATINSEPMDTFWGDRMCSLQDPDGHMWCVATPIPGFDPSKMVDHSKESCPSVSA